MIGVLLGSHQNGAEWFVTFYVVGILSLLSSCPYTMSTACMQIDDFWNEAIKLADLHHPNVVAFYGVVLDGPGDSVATVTEYMVNGSLRQALQRY